MRKWMIYTIVSLAVCTIEMRNVSNSAAYTESEWKMIQEGSWTGVTPEGHKNWYKLVNSPSMPEIQSSMDGSNAWVTLPDKKWREKSGNWVKLGMENKVFVSTDGGRLWNVLTNRAWEDADGNWYMIEKDGSLWKKTAVHNDTEE